MNITLSIGAPNRWRIFHKWAHKCLVCHFTDSWDFVLMLGFVNLRDRLADVEIFWMRLLNERLSLISTPKYLVPPTDLRICPCSRYLLGTRVLDHVTCITTHLLGLNSMSHCNSHRMGPKTEPWATPDVTGTVSDFSLSRTTVCVRPERNACIHFKLWSLIP